MMIDFYSGKRPTDGLSSPAWENVVERMYPKGRQGDGESKCCHMTRGAVKWLTRQMEYKFKERARDIQSSTLYIVQIKPKVHLHSISASRTGRFISVCFATCVGEAIEKNGTTIFVTIICCPIIFLHFYQLLSRGFFPVIHNRLLIITTSQYTQLSSVPAIKPSVSKKHL